MRILSANGNKILDCCSVFVTPRKVEGADDKYDVRGMLPNGRTERIKEFDTEEQALAFVKQLGIDFQVSVRALEE